MSEAKYGVYAELAEMVKGIQSPLIDFQGLQPKVSYLDKGYQSGFGVFYDPHNDALMYIDVENGNIVEMYEVVPTDFEDGEIDLGDHVFTGEADDFCGCLAFDMLFPDEDSPDDVVYQRDSEGKWVAVKSEQA